MFLKEGKEGGKEKIYESIMANNFPNFIENYKLTEPRRSIPYKHMEHEEKYTDIYHNPIVLNK